jgi:aryl-alcohol dehydrogenase-like predicted oxidoreductase
VTRLGLGCVGLGSGADRGVTDDVRLVQGAIDLGVTVFDTADVYGGGASEHVLGRAVRRRRDEVTIATKGGFVFRDRRPVEQWARRRAKSLTTKVRSRRGAGGGSSPSGSYAQQDFSPQYLRRAVHDSLRRLRTDRIDLYQLHGPSSVDPDLADELADLVTAGDVVRFGVGADSVEAADAWIGVCGISAVQVPFGVLDPEAATTTLPLARRHHCEVWARGILGGGLLGLADRDPASIHDHPKWPLVQSLRRIATDSGLDPYQLAFGFLRAHADDVSTLLVGSTSLEHLRDNLESVEAPPLGDELLCALSELTSPPVDREA